MASIRNLLPFVLLVTACARNLAVPIPVPQRAPEPSPPPSSEAVEPEEETGHPGVEQVLAAARGLIGKRKVKVNGRTFRSDCSGFVAGVWSVAGVDLMASVDDAPGVNGVAMIHRYNERFGEHHTRYFPSPGDLAYFDDTYDMNRNGRRDDPLSHVGIVDSVDPDGTIHVIHLSGRGVVRDPMNLLRPSVRTDERGKKINAWLRVKKKNDPPDMPRLMGELFSGFSTVSAVSTAGNER